MKKIFLVYKWDYDRFLNARRWVMGAFESWHSALSFAEKEAKEYEEMNKTKLTLEAQSNELATWIEQGIDGRFSIFSVVPIELQP